MRLTTDDREALAELHYILVDIQGEDVDDPEELLNQLACNPGYAAALGRVLGIDEDDTDDDDDDDDDEEVEPDE